MENLKIQVNNEAESREVQELFFELGAKWGHCGRDLAHLDAKYFHTDCMEIICTDDYEIFVEWDGKETTLAELRDMVKPMKEYLNKTTHEYNLAHTKPDGEWVCIPEGAEALTSDEEGKILIFWKDGFNFVVGLDDQWFETVTSFKEFLLDYPKCFALWQRPAQPEALPFIGDEPKYTDDEVKYMDENGQGRLQSINDQYAEIERVRQQSIDATLAERQSTYGNFEDVAFVTENIMAVLGRVRVNGLQDLPNTHRMALYMIASKMARIVNGDFNHLDSWHDIGGYAKLVEKLIDGE